MNSLLKILIIDDSETNRLLLKEMLQGKAELEEAEDGFEAWQKYSKSLEEKRYDLLL